MKVAIIGGGIIGLATAWRLGQAGVRCWLFDAADEAREASWAAAGMLAPHNEANSPDAFWRLASTALATWQQRLPDWGGSAAVDGHFTGSRDCAFNSPQVLALEQRAAWLQAAGISVQLDRGADCAQHHELAQGPQGVQAVLSLPAGQVDPRRVMAALQQRIVAQGNQLLYGCKVHQLGPGQVSSDAGELAVDEVIIASGAWTPQLAQLAGIHLAGQPVKGQMLRLAAPANLLRGFIHADDAYIVPRAGQGYIVGATMVEAGFDRGADPEAIRRLAAGARRCVPALGDASIAETWTGLRPRLARGRPLIDRIRPSLCIATGHFRNGILLAPLTADILADLVLHGRSAPAICRIDQDVHDHEQSLRQESIADLPTSTGRRAPTWSNQDGT